MKKISEDINGYYRKEQLPNKSGVYFVFAATYNHSDNVIYDARLIYVGESGHMHERHNGTKENPHEHEHYQDFLDELEDGESLWYACMLIPNEDDRVWIQDAYIYALQPVINDIGRDNYSHSEGITVSLSTNKNNIGLPSSISIRKGFFCDWIASHS